MLVVIGRKWGSGGRDRAAIERYTRRSKEAGNYEERERKGREKEVGLSYGEQKEGRRCADGKELKFVYRCKWVLVTVLGSVSGHGRGVDGGGVEGGGGVDGNGGGFYYHFSVSSPLGSCVGE